MNVGISLIGSLLTNKNVLELLHDLSDQHNLSVTIRESSKGAAIAGFTTFVGGICMGPPGFILGGALGGLAAYASSNNFKPVSQVIYEMPEGKKHLLCKKVKEILVATAIPYSVTLSSYVTANPEIANTILNILKEFITTELGMFLKN